MKKLKDYKYELAYRRYLRSHPWLPVREPVKFSAFTIFGSIVMLNALHYFYEFLYWMVRKFCL